jgi:hypothetical protein
VQTLQLHIAGMNDVVHELELQMAEAAGPAALRQHEAWSVALSFAIALMTKSQRRRLGRFIEHLEHVVAAR